jgi:rSAM/selenodomain-associated transferase 1
MDDSALLVIAKRPANGKTKTRLTPDLTPAQSASLYECFLKDTLVLAASASAAMGARLFVLYLPEGEEDYFRSIAPTADLLLQEGGDLGARLDNGIRRCLERGFRHVVIMDSDSPSLPASSLAAAFARLREGAPACFGPCDDGGYYLIGASQPQPGLLLDVQMSTDHVLADTLARAEALGIRVALLPEHYDIDVIADVRRLARELAGLGADIAPNTRRWLAETGLGP